MKVYIREKSWLGRQAAKQLQSPRAAIVISNKIHLWGVSKTEFLQTLSWVRHEVEHVKQFKQHGTVKFIVLYLYETSLKGYYNNRFEVEARSRENDLDILKQVQFM